MSFSSKSAVVAAFLVALAVLAAVLPASAATRLGYADSPAANAVTGKYLTVAGGEVVAHDGRSAAHVAVNLYTWPSNMPRGGKPVPWQLLASTFTDSAGRFTIRVGSSALQAHAVHGVVNVEAVALSPSGLAVYNFPLTLLARHGELALSRPIPLGQSSPLKLSLHLAPSGQVSKAEAATLRKSVTPDSCSIFWTKSLGPKWVIVGQGYGNINVNIKFTYGKGQSSSLGIGYSPSGNPGSFTAAGTNSVSHTSRQGFSPIQGAQKVLFETLFIYQETYSVCYLPHGGYSTYYLVSAQRWIAGTKYVYLKKAPIARYCVPESHVGDYLTQDDYSAVEWSAGVSIPALALSLSAQTGYDTDASITITFNKRPGHLCGTNDYPGGAARQLVANP